MKQRIVSGAVLVVFVAAITLFDKLFPLALNIAVALISAAATFELAKALGMEKKSVFLLSSMITAALAPFFDGTPRFLLYFVFTILIFSGLLRHYREITFKEVAVLYSMVIMIPCALSAMIALRELNRDYGIFCVLAAVFSAWVADAGAYFAGTFFGKHKLCPDISPKKTVEGAVGGLVINVLVMLLGGLVFSRWIYGGEVQANYFALFLVGFLGAPISILGDLSFSLIKRGCHIKDFGQVIPGHGGILDRFDSVIFTAPFVYLVASYLPLMY